MGRTSWSRLSTLSWPSREEAPQVSFISVDTASGTSPVAASTTLHDNKHDDAQDASLHVVLERPRDRYPAGRQRAVAGQVPAKAVESTAAGRAQLMRVSFESAADQMTYQRRAPGGGPLATALPAVQLAAASPLPRAPPPQPPAPALQHRETIVRLHLRHVHGSTISQG